MCFIECESSDFKKHCHIHSDFSINFMVHKIFCNLAAFVFLLFLFWSLCFNKYIFYCTKGKPTQCLMCITAAAVGGGKKPGRKEVVLPFSLVSFWFTTTWKYSILLYSLCLLLQHIQDFADVLGFLPCDFACNVFRKENGAGFSKGKIHLDDSILELH